MAKKIHKVRYLSRKDNFLRDAMIIIFESDPDKSG
jgi:hypothetical protein